MTIASYFSGAIDWTRLRGLDSAEQDAELRRQAGLYPELVGKLAEALAYWRFPTKRIVLQEFAEAFPGITAADVEALLACYRRCYPAHAALADHAAEIETRRYRVLGGI